MKVFRILLIAAFALLAFGRPSNANAGAFTYTSSIQVQNLESTQASINIRFFRQSDGAEVTTALITDTVPANGQKAYFPLSSAPDGFNGSVVIESTTQVASISNVVGNNFAATASYVAASSGNTTVLLPLLMKGNSGYNTWFNVQNTGSSTAHISIQYSDIGAPVTADIEPSAAKTFDQTTEAHPTKVFSAIVTSDQPIAATVIEENTDIMFAYSGFSAGTTDPVFPLINANNAGYQTGVTIQNAGNTDSQVTVSYTPSIAGTACTETQTIPMGESKTFALNAFAGAPLPGMTTNCVGGARFVGSAQVTTNSASQPLVGIINQLKIGVNGEAYGSFDASSATAKVVLPLIMDRNGNAANGVYFTSINLMNVGGAQTTVNCVFTNTTYSFSKTLQPGEGYPDLQNGKIADKYVGAATCTAGSGGQIVAVVNELGSLSSADQLLVYEGISAAP